MSDRRARPTPPGPPGHLRVGTLVDGLYALRGRIDVGTFGEVWRGTDPSGATVALKFLRVGLTGDAGATRRFEQELQALREVAHPNVVRCEGTGFHEGRRYIVLEFVDGEPLSSWLARCRQRGALPPTPVVLGVFRQIAEGIAAAHALTPPITHRDLKPPNVMLELHAGAPVRAKVLDFGVARFGEGGQTVSGDVVGTPPYMSPEQARPTGEAVGPWSDVFSLGVLLLEMLTLRPSLGPTGEYLADFVREREGELSASLARALAATPELQPVLYRALRAESGQRPADARQLLDELLSSGADVPREVLREQLLVPNAEDPATPRDGGGDHGSGGEESSVVRRSSRHGGEDDPGRVSYGSLSDASMSDDEDGDEQLTRVWSGTGPRPRAVRLEQTAVIEPTRGAADDRTEVIVAAGPPNSDPERTPDTDPEPAPTTLSGTAVIVPPPAAQAPRPEPRPLARPTSEPSERPVGRDTVADRSREPALSGITWLLLAIIVLLLSAVAYLVATR